MKHFSCLVSIFLLVLSGCYLRYEDVSTEPKYAPLVGNFYSLQKDMLIYGLNLPPGYGEDINIYVIIPNGSGPDGPHVLSKNFLEAGAILEISSVRKSINHLPGYQEIEAVVEVKAYKKEANVPVVIDLEYLQSTNYMHRLK